MAGRFRSQNLKSKEEETSLLSEAPPKAIQYNTTLNGVEKSSRNGSSGGKYMYNVRSW